MSSSRRTSVEGAAVEKASPGREEASPSAAEATPDSALRPDGQPPTNGSNVARDAAGTSGTSKPEEQKPAGSPVAAEPTETREDHEPREPELAGSDAAAKPAGTSEGPRPGEQKPAVSPVAAEPAGTSEGHKREEQKPVGSAVAAELAGTREGHEPGEPKLVGSEAAAKPAGTSESPEPGEQKPVVSLAAAEPAGTSEGHKPPEQKPVGPAGAAQLAGINEDHEPGEPIPVGSPVAVEPAGTSASRKPEQMSGLQLSTSAASERSIELTAGPSSSLAYVQSGLLSPSKGTSRSRADLVTEASQTLDDSTVDGVYRSLTLQFSPSRRSQQDSWSRATSPGGSQAPLSPKSPSSPGIGTPSVAAALASRVWSSFTRPQEATDDVQTKLAHSEELFKGAAGPLTAEKARSMTTQASSGRQDQASLSPRTTAGWMGSPWRLDVTEDTFKRISRSKSPTAADSQIGAALSAEAAELEDTLAVPRVPWATLAVIWLAAQAHWKFLHKHYPERCASAVAIVHEGHWSRAVFAAFHHVDFSHLTSNLVRFFFKGIVLEAALGTTHFAAIFAIAVFAVGLLNTALIEIAYLVTRSSYLHTMCAHTFSGVVVALQVFGFSHYWEATVHYGKYEHSVGTHMLSLLFADLGFLWLSLKREWLSMAIGFVVGCIMVAVMRVPYRRRHLYLVAAPKTPVTYALMCAVVSAYMYGPYAEPSALDKATLTFRVPPWRLFMLSPLYVANVYLLAYALLTLFTVGQRLERNLGAFRLLLLAPALLFAVSVLRDGLRFVLWKYQLAIWSTMPPPTPHSGDCCCGLVGTLLAMKAVYHGIRPDAAYRLGTVCIQVSFWPGLLLELTQLLLYVREGSAIGHVTGVLVGLAVSRLLRDRRWLGQLVPAATISSSFAGSSQDYPETPAPGLD